MTEHRTQQRNDTPRVPPHNLEAEAALLGAALLRRDAAVAVADLGPAPFYKPANQMIAAAVLELTAAGDPVDPVTVAETLRRNGRLEPAGGMTYLSDLVIGTPSTTSSSTYARIVDDAHRLRTVIAAGAAIADLGYTSGDSTDAYARAAEITGTLTAPARPDDGTLIDLADVAALLAGDLEPERAELLRRTDGTALLYPGKMHTIQAEPSAGKTWVALVAVDEVLNLGGSAVYIDHEDSPTGLLARLLAAGAHPAAIAERFAYVNPPGKIGPGERAELAQLVDRMNPDLVIIDGVGESMARNGLQEDSAHDFLLWTNLLPRWITRTGATVVMLDHVVKDPEQRGRYGRGTGAKLGVIDGVAYTVRIRRAFSRHRPGTIDLVIAKDRPGGVGAIGETAASMNVTPHADGARVVLELTAPAVDVAPTDTWKPTHLMAQIAQALAESSTSLTATAVKAMVSGKPALKSQALARLIAEGYVAEVRSGRTVALRLVRAYDGKALGAALPAPAWRTEPPEELTLDLDTEELDHSWIDDAYIARLEEHDPG